jgi:hypothetical protein
VLEGQAHTVSADTEHGPDLTQQQTRLIQRGGLVMNRPGMSGDSSPWEGWSHVRENVYEVPGRVA